MADPDRGVEAAANSICPITDEPHYWWPAFLNAPMGTPTTDPRFRRPLYCCRDCGVRLAPGSGGES